MKKGSGLLGLGLLVTVVALVGMVGIHAWMELQIGQLSFNVDPATGHLIDSTDSPWWPRFPSSGAFYFEHNIKLLAAALVGLLACVIGLWRRGSHLVGITAPIWAALVVAVAFATLADLNFRDALATLDPFEPYQLHIGCSVSLDQCSHVRSVEWLRGVCLVALSVTALALIPAGVAAWRVGARGAMPRAASLGLFAEGSVAETCSTPGTAAFRRLALDENSGARRHDALHHGLLGQQGHRLGRGWSRAAIVWVIIGALAMIWTRAHREDRRDILERCEATDWQYTTQIETSYVVNWRRGSPNASPADIQAATVDLDACTTQSWGGPAYQMFADGTLTTVPELGRSGSFDEALDRYDGQDIEARLRWVVEYTREIERVRGDEPEPLVIQLYIDERVQMDRLGKWFADIKDMGYDEVRLYGQSEEQGELATMGSWRRRLYCELASVDLRDLGWVPEHLRDLYGPEYRFRAVAAALRR